MRYENELYATCTERLRQLITNIRSQPDIVPRLYDCIDTLVQLFLRNPAFFGRFLLEPMSAWLMDLALFFFCQQEVEVFITRFQNQEVSFNVGQVFAQGTGEGFAQRFDFYSPTSVYHLYEAVRYCAQNGFPEKVVVDSTEYTFRYTPSMFLYGNRFPLSIAPEILRIDCWNVFSALFVSPTRSGKMYRDVFLWVGSLLSIKGTPDNLEEHFLEPIAPEFLRDPSQKLSLFDLFYYPLQLSARWVNQPLFLAQKIFPDGVIRKAFVRFSYPPAVIIEQNLSQSSEVSMPNDLLAFFTEDLREEFLNIACLVYRYQNLSWEQNTPLETFMRNLGIGSFFTGPLRDKMQGYLKDAMDSHQSTGNPIVARIVAQAM